MGRNNKRSDLDGRLITYVSPEFRDRDTESRLSSWIRANISKSTLDFGLGAAGAGAAVASVIFAGVMMTGDLSHPSFGGSEYLLLFTRPLQHAGVEGRQPAVHDHDHGIDFTSTGSIGTVAREKTSDSLNSSNVEFRAASQVALSPRKDYVLTHVSGGVAAIKGPTGVFVAETGSLLPNGDLVVSIDRRAGRWVVVTSGGLIESQ